MGVGNRVWRRVRRLASLPRHLIRKVRRKFLAFNNLRRSFVSIELHSNIPRFVLHEKYEGKVKWTLRLMTALGIVLSLISIPVWYLSLAVALVLLALERFLQRTVFHYTSIYVMPMPTFTYDPEQWVGMAYAFAQQEGDPDIVGPAFRQRWYAVEFLNLLRRWNYENPEDHTNNIHLSFILEKQPKYAVYLYPNLRRQSASSYFDQVEERMRTKKPGKRHQQLVVAMTFCKLFPFSPSSQLTISHNRHHCKGPFLLTTFVQEGSSYAPVFDPEPIMKFEYKHERRDKLTLGEREYMHGKSTMGL